MKAKIYDIKILKIKKKKGRKIMKKKLCVGLFIFVLAFMVCVSKTNATENTELLDNPVLISSDDVNAEESIIDEILFSEKNINDKTVYNLNESVELKDEIINGNAYLLGNDVTIENEIINGDLFICANNVKLGENVILNGNVFICASNLDISATINREFFCFAKDVKFEEKAHVLYDANISAEHIVLKGTFERNFNASVSNMEISETAMIYGDLNYTSDTEATINENAQINNINFDKHVEEKETAIDVITRYVLDFAKYFVITMVVMIIFIKLLPRFVENCKKYIGISSFGIGIATLILAPILIVLLFVLRVTSTVAIGMLALLMLILIISMAITNISLAKYFEAKKPNVKLPIWVAIVTAITWIIYQIPVLGGILAFVWVTTGLGIATKYCFTKNK